MLCTKCKKVPPLPGGKRCQTCLDYMREYKAAYRQAPKKPGQCQRTDCSKAATAGMKSCTDCREQTKTYEEAIKDKLSLKQRRLRRERRQRVFDAYGGAYCKCCGEDYYEFLSIDHAAGNGAEHRRLELRGRDLYYWLIKNDFPPGFRVLCMNCNFALGHHGYCPHGTLVQRCSNGLAGKPGNRRKK